MWQIFHNVSFDWLSRRRLFLFISVLLLLAGLASAMIRQLVPGGTEAFNLGVDFQAGTLVVAKFKQRPAPDAIRAALSKVGINDAVIQPDANKPDEVLIKVPRQTSSSGDAQQDKSQVDAGRSKISQALGTLGEFSIIGTEAVDPIAGQQLRTQSITVTLLALVGVLLYIAFRFEWTYGAAAVLTVFHDVLVTVGFFSIFQWEINLTVIAALLTLVGFSVNDTIVTFDRIRENLRLRRRATLYDLTNEAINQTLSRTIITAGLVFLSVLAMVLFGGEVLRGFSLALLIGIVTGTYSTIAIASPIMVWWQQRLEAGNARAIPAKAGSAKKTEGGETSTRARSAKAGNSGMKRTPEGAARS